MTIECYYSQCEFHSCQEQPDDGPFCFEQDCKATKEQVIHFQQLRNEYLDSIYGKGKHNGL